MSYEFYALRNDPEFKTFKVAPVSAALGGRVTGLDISKPLSEETLEELRQALLHFMVLFFEDQDLTPAQHVAFAKTWGEVQMGGTIPRLEEQPEVKKQQYDKESKLVGDVNMHADDTFVEIPSRVSALYGVDMPPAGGDTIWINCEAAYHALSDRMKTMLEGLNGLHDIAGTFGIINGISNYAIKAEISKEYPAIEHPVFRTHPETGRKCIFVNEMVTTKIMDLPEEESELLLKYLLDHLKKPIFQCRLQWRNGTMAVWDNRATQHLILPDFRPSFRLNHRVAIADDKRPV